MVGLGGWGVYGCLLVYVCVTRGECVFLLFLVVFSFGGSSLGFSLVGEEEEWYGVSFSFSRGCSNGVLLVVEVSLL